MFLKSVWPCYCFFSFIESLQHFKIYRFETETQTTDQQTSIVIEEEKEASSLQYIFFIDLCINVKHDEHQQVSYHAGPARNEVEKITGKKLQL